MSKHQQITEKIIGAFYEVYNSLGYGFLEQVYEKVMVLELEQQGLMTACQQPIQVVYKGAVVGEYRADLVVEGKVIVELKAVPVLTKNEECQLLNYLTSTDMEVGLLLNFGPKAEVKRKVYDNENKKYLAHRFSQMNTDLNINPVNLCESVSPNFKDAT